MADHEEYYDPLDYEVDDWPDDDLLDEDAEIARQHARDMDELDIEARRSTRG